MLSYTGIVGIVGQIWSGLPHDDAGFPVFAKLSVPAEDAGMLVCRVWVFLGLSLQYRTWGLGRLRVADLLDIPGQFSLTSPHKHDKHRTVFSDRRIETQLFQDSRPATNSTPYPGQFLRQDIKTQLFRHGFLWSST